MNGLTKFQLVKNIHVYITRMCAIANLRTMRRSHRKFKTRNVYSILVNANNDLLVRGEPKRVEDLKEGIKEFIMNPQRREDLAETPVDAIVSMKNDRGTKYETYLEVYNEVKAAYNELRDEQAQAKFGKLYEFLAKEQKGEINAIIPLKLSEAEPTEFGEE